MRTGAVGDDRAGFALPIDVAESDGARFAVGILREILFAVGTQILDVDQGLFTGDGAVVEAELADGVDAGTEEGDRPQKWTLQSFFSRMKLWPEQVRIELLIGLSRNLLRRK